MSEIIKSGNSLALARVKKVPIPARLGSAASLEDEADRLKRRIGALESELRLREAAILRLRTDVEDAFARGAKEGRVRGLAEAEDRQVDRLGILEKGLERAQDDLAASLGSLERLASLLAKDCLDIMFGDPDHRDDLLAGLIAAQMAKIERSALLGIYVSPNDFADTTALARLAKRAGVAAVRISVDADLPAGACVMRLRLGEHEIGIGQQWGVLGEHLIELSLPEAAG